MKYIFSSLSRLAPVLFFVFSCFYASAATKYVSNTGNNSNSGNSWAQAWLTIHHASTNIATGDTVWVANGNYAGFDCRINANAANPIVFIAAGNAVVINTQNPITPDGINIENADYIEINGFRVIDQPRNGIRLASANFCIVRNTYCENNFERGIFTGHTDDILIEYNECLESIDEHGIYVSNSSDRSIIRYNVCHHNNRGGIQINADLSQGSPGISYDPQIYGNILYENGVACGAAINLDGVQRALIYNNLLYENHATGIALFQQDGGGPSSDGTIVHNTIVSAIDGRWCILIVNGATGGEVYNNIIINRHSFRGSIALDPDAVPGFDSDYNIVINRLSKMGDGSSVPLTTWQGYGYDENSMLADALGDIFVNPGVDYHLLDNSQAINAGSGAFSFGVNKDLDGVTRPQGSEHDLGAYENDGILAIGDEEDKRGYSKKENPGIIISRDRISWQAGFEGKMELL
ncbi:MAG: right-handed parallel beta-helix repeat-containing protein, partial [Saprospiraceae bacterium]